MAEKRRCSVLGLYRGGLKVSRKAEKTIWHQNACARAPAHHIQSTQVNKVGEDEEAISESQGLAMARRQKSMGQLFGGLDPGQSFEEAEEDEGDDNDNYDEKKGSSVGSK